jgi:eukaryotic-like serine/threonine-protein kinase
MGTLFRKAANNTGPEELIGSKETPVIAAYDWSRDGRYILYLNLGDPTGADLWVLDLHEHKSKPFLQSPFAESQGQFSPDGRWIAYSSDASGRFEIYVRSFSGKAAQFQISNDGGVQPRWRGDGKELYYLTAGGKMMAVAVKTGGDGFEREVPRVLFESGWLAGSTGSGPQGFRYDVTRDGQRFLFVDPGPGDAEQPLTLVTNWQASLKR